MTVGKLVVFALLLIVFLLFFAGPLSAATEGTSEPGSSVTAPTDVISMESRIDKRRDALERRRDRYWDVVTGRRWRQPPWVNAHRDWMDHHEVVMDDVFRNRRDAIERYQDAWGRWTHPWSQWRQDRADVRRNAYDLDRLARDEYFDRLFYARPFGPWGGYW